MEEILGRQVPQGKGYNLIILYMLSCCALRIKTRLGYIQRTVTGMEEVIGSQVPQCKEYNFNILYMLLCCAVCMKMRYSLNIVQPRLHANSATQQHETYKRVLTRKTALYPTRCSIIALLRSIQVKRKKCAIQTHLVTFSVDLYICCDIQR